MKNKKHDLMMLALLFSLSTPLYANVSGKDLVNRGNGKGATACLACHGMDGGGQEIPGYPMLAGLNRDYLIKQLHDIAAGKRKQSVMVRVASALNDKEINAVADYYSQLTPPATRSVQHNPDLLIEGKQLAEKGDWPNNIPACFSCHGDAAQGVGKDFPALAGQHARYISDQIEAWKRGKRDNDPNQLMKGIAMRLSDEQVLAVSSYLSILQGEK